MKAPQSCTMLVEEQGVGIRTDLPADQLGSPVRGEQFFAALRGRGSRVDLAPVKRVATATAA